MRVLGTILSEDYDLVLVIPPSSRLTLSSVDAGSSPRPGIPFARRVTLSLSEGGLLVLCAGWLDYECGVLGRPWGLINVVV